MSSSSLPLATIIRRRCHSATLRSTCHSTLRFLKTEKVQAMLDRRQMLGSVTAIGLGTPAFHRAMTHVLMQEAAVENAQEVTADMIRNAEWISGYEFNDEERDEVAERLNRSLSDWQAFRTRPISFDSIPAVQFQTLADRSRIIDRVDRTIALTEPRPNAPTRPGTDDELAFLPVAELSRLVQAQVVTSVELTELYLKRLKRFNPMLNCVVTLTEDLARQQARQADAEITAGQIRGPLHGIPWGAKDLMAVPGYPTTWGIPQFEYRILEESATVAQRLTDAGAVLVAKLSLGAIAMGDLWFRGMTRSPWNYRVGSSGSSAGSASAAVAGLVGFAIGTETLGSIVSPSRRCGATGFRPTFGRVSRAGCMSLSWSMDKVGPIARSAEDCALVFNAIHGADGIDPSAVNASFRWPGSVDFSSIKIGYTDLPRRASGDGTDDDSTNRPDLQLLENLGCTLVRVTLPEEQNEWILADVIDVEAAAVFDSMLQRRQTDGWNTWPPTFRAAQFISAIDYLRLMRRRRELQLKMETLFADVDMLVNCNDLLITNLTGHPTCVIPTSYRERNDRMTPRSMLLTGRLMDDDRLLAVTHAVQQQLDAHLQHPPLEALLAEWESEQAAEEAVQGKDD